MSEIYERTGEHRVPLVGEWYESPFLNMAPSRAIQGHSTKFWILRPAPAEEKPAHKPLKFMECDTCRAKPGMPILCAGCLNNRGLICSLEDELADKQQSLAGALAECCGLKEQLKELKETYWSFRRRAHSLVENEMDNGR